MDNAHLRYVVMVGSGIALVGMIISAMMLSQAQKQNEVRNKRLAAISDMTQRVTVLEVSAFSERSEVEKRPVLRTLSWIFGFDPERPQLYPTKWWIIAAGLLVIARLLEFIVADLLGALALASVPVIWLVMCHKVFSYFANRRRQRLLFEFPDALAMLVRSIRVGIPVSEALRNVGRNAPPLTAAGFNRLVDQTAVGVSMEDALNALAHDTGLTEYRFFATTLILQNQTGGTLSDTLESLADVIRRRVALKAKGKAMTSEVRSSSAVLAVLPIGIAALLWAVSPQYIMPLFVTAQGRSYVGLAAIMLACGILSIHTIIQKTLS